MENLRESNFVRHSEEKKKLNLRKAPIFIAIHFHEDINET